MSALGLSHGLSGNAVPENPAVEPVISVGSGDLLAPVLSCLLTTKVHREFHKGEFTAAADPGKPKNAAHKQAVVQPALAPCPECQLGGSDCSGHGLLTSAGSLLILPDRLLTGRKGMFTMGKRNKRTGGEEVRTAWLRERARLDCESAFPWVPAG